MDRITIKYRIALMRGAVSKACYLKIATTNVEANTVEMMRDFLCWRTYWIEVEI